MSYFVLPRLGEEITGFILSFSRNFVASIQWSYIKQIMFGSYTGSL